MKTEVIDIICKIDTDEIALEPHVKLVQVSGYSLADLFSIEKRIAICKEARKHGGDVMEVSRLLPNQEELVHLLRKLANGSEGDLSVLHYGSSIAVANHATKALVVTGQARVKDLEPIGELLKGENLVQIPIFMAVVARHDWDHVLRNAKTRRNFLYSVERSGLVNLHCSDAIRKSFCIWKNRQRELGNLSEVAAEGVWTYGCEYTAKEVHNRRSLTAIHMMKGAQSTGCLGQDNGYDDLVSTLISKRADNIEITLRAYGKDLADGWLDIVEHLGAKLARGSKGGDSQVALGTHDAAINYLKGKAYGPESGE